jgi:hypothetical protein
MSRTHEHQPQAHRPVLRSMTQPLATRTPLKACSCSSWLNSFSQFRFLLSGKSESTGCCTTPVQPRGTFVQCLLGQQSLSIPALTRASPTFLLVCPNSCFTGCYCLSPDGRCFLQYIMSAEMHALKYRPCRCSPPMPSSSAMLHPVCIQYLPSDERPGLTVMTGARYNSMPVAPCMVL